MAGSASRVVFATICGRSRERCRLRLRWAVVRSLQQGHDDRLRAPNPRSAARSRSLRTATASESTSMRARSISTCPSRNSMPGVRDGRRACRRPLDTCPSTSEASNRCRRERTGRSRTEVGSRIRRVLDRLYIGGDVARPFSHPGNPLRTCLSKVTSGSRRRRARATNSVS